jgi:hypothetical protein
MLKFNNSMNKEEIKIRPGDPKDQKGKSDGKKQDKKSFLYFSFIAEFNLSLIAWANWTHIVLKVTYYKSCKTKI